MSFNDAHDELMLMKRLKSGDRSAFSEIYGLFSTGLIRYVFSKTGDLDQAKDIVHDIFTKLWDQREDLQIDTSLTAYLYRQGLNRCLNSFRHQRVVDSHVLQSVATFMESYAESADRRILDMELGDMIRVEIQALPPKMRETIELRLHQGLSNREIADQMSLSEHTVATQIKRALKILRGKIKYTLLLILPLF